MNAPKFLRDYLYIDLPRISSLYSQLTGGLVTEIAQSRTSEQDERNIRQYDLKVFKPEFGGAKKEGTEFVETRVMHHDLVNEVENLLLNEGFCIDVNNVLHPDSIDSGDAHTQLRDAFYVKANGWALLEDFERIKAIAKRFNDLVKFINGSSVKNFKESPEFLALEEQLGILKENQKSIKDRNQRSNHNRQIRIIENQIIEAVEGAASTGSIDQWIIDGIETWVDVLASDAIFFYLYPFADHPSFHIQGHLKKECFMGDLKSIEYAYGGRPTVKLTMLGLITSVPFPADHPFDPMSEFVDHVSTNPKDDPVKFEAAMRGIFRGFEGLSRFSKFDRYPNIVVYPLTIFRDILPSKMV